MNETGLCGPVPGVEPAITCHRDAVSPGKRLQDSRAGRLLPGRHERNEAPSPSGEGVPHARLAPSRSELACEPIKAALAVDFVTAVEEVPAQAVFRAVEGVGPFELLDASLG